MKVKINGKEYETQYVILAPGSPMGFVLRGTESGSLSVPSLPHLRRSILGRIWMTAKIWILLNIHLARARLERRKKAN